MLRELENLSSSELEIMLKAPMLVCILIAGADNKIDKKEIKGAIELAKRAKAKANLSEFYRMSAEDFEDKLKIIFQSFPHEPEERNPLIKAELAQLNGILSKINKTFASDFHKSLLYIAKHIAESSGGLMGLNKVGDEEEILMNLPMIKAPAAS